MFTSATRILGLFESQDFVDEIISDLENQLDRINTLVSTYDSLLPQDFIIEIKKNKTSSINI